MTGLDIMKQYLGLQEVRDKQKIMAFLKKEAVDNDISIDPAKTSWCAAIMNATQRAAGGKGTGKLNAQSFNLYVDEVRDLSEAREGDILVFHFPSDNDWQGHVTYLVEINQDGTVKCLGGNQANSVSYANYSQKYIRHIRRGV